MSRPQAARGHFSARLPAIRPMQVCTGPHAGPRSGRGPRSRARNSNVMGALTHQPKGSAGHGWPRAEAAGRSSPGGELGREVALWVPAGTAFGNSVAARSHIQACPGAHHSLCPYWDALDRPGTGEGRAARPTAASRQTAPAVCDSPARPCFLLARAKVAANGSRACASCDRKTSLRMSVFPSSLWRPRNRVRRGAELRGGASWRSCAKSSRASFTSRLLRPRS